MKLVEEQLVIEKREHDICKTELVKAALRERSLNAIIEERHEAVLRGCAIEMELRAKLRDLDHPNLPKTYDKPPLMPGMKEL
jgi:hypothetical protein